VAALSGCGGPQRSASLLPFFVLVHRTSFPHGPQPRKDLPVRGEPGMRGVRRSDKGLLITARKGMVTSWVECAAEGFARHVLQAPVARPIESLRASPFAITGPLGNPQAAIAPQLPLGAEARGRLTVGREAGRANQTNSWDGRKTDDRGILPRVAAKEREGLVRYLPRII
jgi:hypothetical protein